MDCEFDSDGVAYRPAAPAPQVTAAAQVEDDVREIRMVRDQQRRP